MNYWYLGGREKALGNTVATLEDGLNTVQARAEEVQTKATDAVKSLRKPPS